MLVLWAVSGSSSDIRFKQRKQFVEVASTRVSQKTKLGSLTAAAVTPPILLFSKSGSGAVGYRPLDPFTLVQQWKQSGLR